MPLSHLYEDRGFLRHIFDHADESDGTDEVLPVGTILPWLPVPNSDQIPPRGWVICAGQTVVDPESDFNMTQLPDLTKDIFLMGTDINKIGIENGANSIKIDGKHGHSGVTDRPTRDKDDCDNGGDKDPSSRNHRHSFTIPVTEGEHNHGGENRPLHLGVFFIIKIK